MGKLPIKYQIEDSFFQEETKGDFFVDHKRKEVWAVELDLLNEFDSICKQMNLKYYLYGGTLLGAVRHQGFIPWDDDIDIMMFREDYNKLINMAEKKFTYPYFFQTVYNDKNFFRPHCRLRNSLTCGANLWELRHLTTNEGIFIDIFPNDGVPDNKMLYDIYITEIEELWFKFKLLHYYQLEDNINSKVYDQKCQLANKILHSFGSYENLYLEIENKIQAYSDSEYIQPVGFIASNMFPKTKYLSKREWFQEELIVPFEFLNVPIPIKYDEVLRNTYGDNYMTPIRADSFHGNILFNTHRSYQAIRLEYKNDN